MAGLWVSLESPLLWEGLIALNADSSQGENFLNCRGRCSSPPAWMLLSATQFMDSSGICPLRSVILLGMAQIPPRKGLKFGDTNLSVSLLGVR